MTIRRPRWKAVAVSLVVIAVAAGITLGVTTLLGVTFQGESSAQGGSGRQFVHNLMATANRDRLAICVQPVGFGDSGSVAAAAEQLQASAKPIIEEALAVARNHPQWDARGGAGPLSPVVDVGCPSGPATTDPSGHLRTIETIFGHVVEEAGYYSVFVFILPDADLDQLLGASTIRATNIRTANQETICDGDVCGPVSNAIYLKPSDLEDPSFVINQLERVLGLEPWR
jgi:hypothetical protein